MKNEQLTTAYFFSLLLGVMALTVFMFLPYLKTLAVAAAFAVALQPVYRSIRKQFGGRSTPASLLTILIVLLLFLLPVTFVITNILLELQQLSGGISGTPQSISDLFATYLQHALKGVIPGLEVDLHGIVHDAFLQLEALLGSIFTGTVETLVNIFLGTIALFFFLKDGEKFVRYVIILSPLSDKYDLKIVHRLEKAVSAVLRGSLSVSLLYGITTGIGLWIFGIATPLLWALMAALASLIPLGAIVTVLLPSVFYLFFIGKTASAIGLILWSACCMAMIDNFVSPRLVGQGVRIHNMFVLFSMLGGVQFFGPIGVLLGPLVLSLLFALLDIYQFVITNDQEF